jgi:hypothetical protein
LAPIREIDHASASSGFVSSRTDFAAHLALLAAVVAGSSAGQVYRVGNDVRVV